MSNPTPLSGYGDARLVQGSLSELRRMVQRPVRLMEVCGTHTMALFESGLRPVLESMGIKLVSGPGCPVCVTSQADIDYILALAGLEDVTVCTFGDMLRVPGTSASLEQMRSGGADVRVVYSPLDALEIAQELPERQVVFLAIGFETTTPAVAFTLKQAAEAHQDNFHAFVAHKTIPAALLALATDPQLRIDGFLCPGHVSTVIGSRAYEPVAASSGKPCVVAGFEPLDLVQGVLLLAKQIVAGEARAENAYRRAVRDEGNSAARELIASVFEPCDAEWRGLGVIPGSGLRLKVEFRRYDARLLEPGFLPPEPSPALATCRCGEVLKGLIEPSDCPNFGAACSPESPLGACMVSQEGACRAYHRYRGLEAAQ